MTIRDVLILVGSRIEELNNVAVNVRFTRAQELGDLADDVAYYVEPGGFDMERRNVGCARKTYRVRAISAEHVLNSNYEERAQEREVFWENVAYDLVSHPMLGDRLDGVFVLSVATFPDAPAGYSAEALEDGISLLSAGIEVTIVID